MKRLVTTVLGLVALASAATTATAGGGGGFLVANTSGVSNGHSVFAAIEVRGAVTVDFHGDPASGCAQAHLCDVAGTVRWDPSGTATLITLAYRYRGKRFEDGFLTVGDFDPSGSSAHTTSRVRRDGAPGSLCADRGGISPEESASGPRRGSGLVLRLIDVAGSSPDGVLHTRCAGPLAADLATLLPARTISERALLRHPTLDFSADRTFSSHGLSGTLHSTVVLKVVHTERVPNTDSGPPRGTRRVRRRQLEVDYRIVRVSGAVDTAVKGLPDPDECGPLDACGLVGSVTLAHRASSGTATLYAFASARRSRVELRRALGIAPGPRPRGVVRDGAIAWDHDRGSVSSDLTRDGTPACADTAPVPGGGASLELDFSGRRVTAQYIRDAFGSGDLLRTRCPGPGSSDAARSIASGSFPLSVFRHRRVTLHLRRGARLTGVGYGGRTRPDVTVVLRRTGIHDSTFQEDVSTDFAGDNIRPIH